MQDDEKKIDDDIIEDADFDLDDFDDDDLADDDSWDEFDDGDAASTETTDIADDSDISDAGLATPKKKSFVQKNFNLIVIAVVGVFGGGFFLTQMGGAPAPVTEASDGSVQNNTAEIDRSFDAPVIADIPPISSDNDLLPPMPTPIESAPIEDQDITALSEMIDADTTDIGDSLSNTDSTLTPMPGADADNTILSALSIDEVPTVPVSDEILAVAENNVLTFNETITNEDVAAEENNAITGNEFMDDQSMEPEAAFMNAPTQDVQPTEALMGIPAMVASETMIQTGMGEAPSKAITALENKVSNQNSQLSSKIDQTNQKIEALVASISALEARLDTLTSAPPVQKQASVNASQAKSVPAPPKPVVKKPKPKQQVKSTPPKSSQKVKPKTATTWQLRAAQPGKALVASKGSNDMITVHIGDTLPGIGRISDITIENNKWIIRGTDGVVSQ